LKRKDTLSPLWVRRHASASWWWVLVKELLWREWRGVTYSGRDVDRHDPITQLLLLLVRNCVGADHLLQLAVVDFVDRVAAEDTVGDNGDGGCCAVLDDHVGGFAERATSVGHVVDDDSGATLDISDQNHATNFVGAGALLVNQRELNVKAVGDRSSSVIFVSAKNSLTASL
jgi:hypothetical protein